MYTMYSLFFSPHILCPSHPCLSFSQVYDLGFMFITHLGYPGPSAWSLDWECHWSLVGTSEDTQMKVMISLIPPWIY